MPNQDAEFVAFVTVQRRDLLRTAVLLCAGDESLAEDVVQTTLTRLYLSWHRMHKADSQLAYARRALTNAFIDEMRRAHRRRERPTDLMTSTPSDSPTPWPDTELRTTVLTALGSLGPRQRAVVVLRHWLDLDTNQTAQLLGCSPGTVKSQNARALDHLRSILGGVADDFLAGTDS